MKIVSGSAALLVAMVLCAAIASANEANKSESATKGSSSGGRQSQQQSPSSLKDQQTVQQVQQALNAKGYDAGQANGIWSSKSRDALAQYQKDNGLQPSGQIDPQSIAHLGISTSSGKSAAGGQQGSQPGSKDQQTGSGGYGMMGNEGESRGQSNP